MKYQPQNDLIDPDVPAPKSPFDFDDLGDMENSDFPESAYVIGAGGEVVTEPGDGTTAERRSKPWAKPAAMLLSVAFVALTAWNVYRMLQDPPTPPPPSPVQVKQALYLGVMKIDAYRRAHGVTPNSIRDTDLPSEWYGYRRIDGEHYVLSFRANGAALEYDSQVPKASFFGTPQALLPNGDSI